MQDVLENKEKIYGRYESQNEAISTIMSQFDKLKKETHGEPLTFEEITDYQLLSLKLTRSVTASGDTAKDSWIDLINYARLIYRRRFGEEPIEQLLEIFAPAVAEDIKKAKSEPDNSATEMPKPSVPKADLSDIILDRGLR